MAQGPQEPTCPWSPIAGAPTRGPRTPAAARVRPAAACGGEPRGPAGPGPSASGAASAGGRQRGVRQRAPDGGRRARPRGEAGGAGGTHGAAAPTGGHRRAPDRRVVSWTQCQHRRTAASPAQRVVAGSNQAAVRAVPAVTPRLRTGVAPRDTRRLPVGPPRRARPLSSPRAACPAPLRRRARPTPIASPVADPRLLACIAAGGSRGGRGAGSDGSPGRTDWACIRRVTDPSRPAAARPWRAAAGPLAGPLVVDLTRALAGPHAAMMLGDLGARVIKVETPDGGDDTRGWGPPFVDSPTTGRVSPPTSCRATGTRSR